MTVDQEAVAGYREAIAYNGIPVTFRRKSGNAPNVAIFDADVTALVSDYVQEAVLMQVKREGSVTQGGRRFIVLAADLAKARFPLPLVKNDKAILNKGTPQEEALNITQIDPNKRSIAGAIDVLAVGI